MIVVVTSSRPDDDESDSFLELAPIHLAVGLHGAGRGTRPRTCRRPHAGCRSGYGGRRLGLPAAAHARSPCAPGPRRRGRRRSEQAPPWRSLEYGISRRPARLICRVRGIGFADSARTSTFNFICAAVPLLDAGALLLIHHQETQVFGPYISREPPVGANQDVDFPRLVLASTAFTSAGLRNRTPSEREGKVGEGARGRCRSAAGRGSWSEPGPSPACRRPRPSPQFGERPRSCQSRRRRRRAGSNTTEPKKKKKIPTTLSLSRGICMWFGCLLRWLLITSRRGLEWLKRYPMNLAAGLNRSTTAPRQTPARGRCDADGVKSD